MVEAGEETQADKLTTLEASLLEQIVGLHPDHLSVNEMALLMQARRDKLEVLDGLAGLRRSGLVRQRDDLVEPTYAALCAYELFNL